MVMADPVVVLRAFDRRRARRPRVSGSSAVVVHYLTHARAPSRWCPAVIAGGTASVDEAVPAREPEVGNSLLDERGRLWARGALDIRVRLPAETCSGRAYGN